MVVLDGFGLDDGVVHKAVRHYFRRGLARHLRCYFLIDRVASRAVFLRFGSHQIRCSFRIIEIWKGSLLWFVLGVLRQRRAILRLVLFRLWRGEFGALLLRGLDYFDSVLRDVDAWESNLTHFLQV